MRLLRFVLALLACGLAACGLGDAGRRPGAAQSPLGLELEPVPPAACAALGLRSGVRVIRVGGRARATRLAPGDVIVSVGDAPVSDPDEFARLVAERGSGAIALRVRRADADLYVTLPAAGRVPQPDELFKKRRSPTSTLLRT